MHSNIHILIHENLDNPAESIHQTGARLIADALPLLDARNDEIRKEARDFIADISRDAELLSRLGVK